MLISLLQNAPAPGAAPNPLLQFAPMIFIFVIFYFLLANEPEASKPAAT